MLRTGITISKMYCEFNNTNRKQLDKPTQKTIYSEILLGGVALPIDSWQTDEPDFHHRYDKHLRLYEMQIVIKWWEKRTKIPHEVAKGSNCWRKNEKKWNWGFYVSEAPVFRCMFTMFMFKFYARLNLGTLCASAFAICVSIDPDECEASSFSFSHFMTISWVCYEKKTLSKAAISDVHTYLIDSASFPNRQICVWEDWNYLGSIYQCFSLSFRCCFAVAFMWRDNDIAYSPNELKAFY